jgi:cytochrome c oxidase accessory protein FixG
MPPKENEQQNFRDKIATVDEKGKRIWVYPKKPSGSLYRKRNLVSIILIVFLFIGPFIKINGHPLLMLNILERKFIIFGIGFWPQDFYLFVLVTITLVVFIILFTVVYGRIFCGWACPQTVFMEMLFRKIEYWIEGDARKQRALDAKPMDFEKFIKKGSKHAIFYGISFLIGNTFLAYIIGIDQLKTIVKDPPSLHIAGLTAMIIFSAVFYYIFAFFREQVCTLVCPYGRLQGVLLDQNSIVVAYDFIRGEPRGKLVKSENKSDRGDCVDCNQCVDVCPTGIDIRNGTQLECINCTACIDACNSVMEKVNRPKGLIRYASYNGIKEGIKLKLNPRIVGYSAVLFVLVTVLLVLFSIRAPIETTILRTPGVMYQELDDGRISNLYNITVINKTFDPKSIALKLKSPNGEIDLVGGTMQVPAGEIGESAFFVKLEKSELAKVSIPLLIDVFSGDKLLDQVKSSFIGPNPYVK